MSETMLSIRNLQASVEEKQILKGINLEVRAGEVHAIMETRMAQASNVPSTGRQRRLHWLMGKYCCKAPPLKSGLPNSNARKGIFLAFQYPVENPRGPVICSF